MARRSKQAPGLDLRKAETSHRIHNPRCKGTMYFAGIDRGFHTFRRTSGEEHDVVWHPDNERG